MWGQVALLVITILCLLIVWYNSDSYKRQNYTDYLERSNGDFDKPARQALDTINNIRNPVPTDIFARGRIEDQNIIRGAYGGVRNAPVDVINAALNDYLFALGALVQGDDNIDFELIRARQLADETIDFFPEAQVIMFGITPATRDTAQRRLERAVEGAETKKQVIDKFYDESVKYTSDGQNVHDSKVNSALISIHKKIANSTPNVQEAISDLKKSITISKNPDIAAKKDAALGTIEYMLRINSYITNIGANETTILTDTWTRITDKRNATNYELLFEALTNALADCKEGAGYVCAGGRSSRVIDSLSMLDFETTGSPMTLEMYKNEIMEETKKIFNDEITLAAASKDEKLKAVGDSYSKTGIATDPTTEKTFLEGVRKRIDENLLSYKDKLKSAEIETIRAECHAAII